MTVYPLVFQLGPLQITGYGIMMMVGFLAGGWVMQRHLRQLRMNEDYAADIVVAAVIGGVLGAKLWYVGLTQDLNAIASRSGLVWYGGFIGGSFAVVFNGWRRKVPIRITAELVAPALAIGYALGRIGCFMVQDDYGVPTSLPWGFRFPQGSPATTAQNLSAQFGVPVPDGVGPLEVLAVHPTQLYEALAMMAVFALLWRMRNHGKGMGWLLGVYLALAGFERFLVEFLRAKDDRFLAGFTLAQAASLALCVAGVIVMQRLSRADEVSFPRDAGVAT